MKSLLLGTTPRVSDITVKAKKMCIYTKFQGAPGAAVLVWGLDFENHYPKASNPGVCGITWILTKGVQT